MFRTILQWGLAHPEELAEIVMTNAFTALTAGNRYIASTTHGGKSVSFQWPMTGPGRGAGLNLETSIGLANKALWVIRNHTVPQIEAYLATYPQDVSMATYWTALPNAI